MKKILSLLTLLLLPLSGAFAGAGIVFDQTKATIVGDMAGISISSTGSIGFTVSCPLAASLVDTPTATGYWTGAATDTLRIDINGMMGFADLFVNDVHVVGPVAIYSAPTPTISYGGVDFLFDSASFPWSPDSHPINYTLTPATYPVASANIGFITATGLDSADITAIRAHLGYETIVNSCGTTMTCIALCSPGKFVIGGGCETASSAGVFTTFGPYNSTGYKCFDNSATLSGVYATAICSGVQ